MKSHEELHKIIKEEIGLEPVKFDKPLKSVGVYVLLEKILEPRNSTERHAIIGWGLGNLLNHFEKDLFNIKSLKLINDKEVVKIEAIIYISGLTFEDDHDEFLSSIIDRYVGEDYPQYGYYWDRVYFKWDSATRISDISGFTQMDGGGDNLQSLK